MIFDTFSAVIMFHAGAYDHAKQFPASVTFDAAGLFLCCCNLILQGIFFRLMSKNVVFCLTGLALGLFLGFLLANDLSSERAAIAPLSQTSAASTSTGATAPPLDPMAMGSELPPGHPEVGGASGATGGSPAATSAQAQQAMDAADRAPKDFDLQMNAAAVFYQMRDFNTAALYLQRAVELKPKDIDALTALGNTKYDTDDFTGAATYYERVLALQPKNTDVQTDLGNTYFRRNPPDYKRAIAEYRKTLAVDPNHEKALQNLAAAALQLGDKKMVRETVDNLATVNPNNPALSSLRSSVESMP